MGWNFRQGGKTENPKDTGIKDFSKHIFESVVREATQNAIDNRLNKDEPVTVSFDFDEINSSQIPHFAELVERWNCVYEKWKDQTQYESLIKEIVDQINSFGERIPYLSISDYNTKGMDFTSNPDIDKTRYGAFSRGTHSYHDSDSAAGSEGQGKAALYAVSAMRTIFVHTISDKGSIYEGLTRFATHEYNNQKYNSDGYFPYQPTTPEYEIEPNISMPFRRPNDQLGTTLTMIGLWSYENASEKMIKSALNNFWMAILDGDLIIEINDTTICKETFDGLLQQYLPDRYESSRTKSNPTEYGRAKCYIETWNEKFEETEKYESKDRIPKLGNCILKISQHNEFPGKIVFFREQKMLIYRSRVGQFISPGYCGVFYCGNKDGNKLLRTMESKTHTEWDPKYCSTENDRIAGEEVIVQINNFIKDSWQKYCQKYKQDTFDMPGLEGLTIGRTTIKPNKVCNRCKKNPCECPSPQIKVCSECGNKPCTCPKKSRARKQLISQKDETGWKYILSISNTTEQKEAEVILTPATDSLRTSKEERLEVVSVNNGWSRELNAIKGVLDEGVNEIEFRLNSPERVGLNIKILDNEN